MKHLRRDLLSTGPRHVMVIGGFALSRRQVSGCVDVALMWLDWIEGMRAKHGMKANGRA